MNEAYSPPAAVLIEARGSVKEALEGLIGPCDNTMADVIVNHVAWLYTAGYRAAETQLKDAAKKGAKAKLKAAREAKKGLAEIKCECRSIHCTKCNPDASRG